MDWGWVYATLARNTGWTYRKSGKQPACDVFSLLEHLAEHPPSYVIDAAVHFKPRPKKSKGAPVRDSSELVSAYLGPANRMPDHVRELLAWAQSPGGPSRA